MILLQRMEQKKIEVDFEKWLKVMIFHCPFKILEKIIVRAVEVVITKFYRQTLLKAAELMCNTSTSFSNEMSETRQE
jgi:hypothetical protein